MCRFTLSARQKGLCAAACCSRSSVKSRSNVCPSTSRPILTWTSAGLDIGDSVHIEELAMPEGVSAVAESNLALVAVVPPTVEEAPAAAAEPVEGAEVAPVATEPGKEGEGQPTR